MLLMSCLGRLQEWTVLLLQRLAKGKLSSEGGGPYLSKSSTAPAKAPCRRRQLPRLRRKVTLLGSKLIALHNKTKLAGGHTARIFIR